ncbi:DUF4129 domain-containing protein [Streptomyces armeniacus]|uniref:DUF4129 domain-containing protein n=1 Tax=Streptomyces armeniacus TaxID=83291 RepID=UPI0026D7C31D
MIARGLAEAALRTAAGLRTHSSGSGEDDTPPVTVPREPARRAAEDELSEPAYRQDEPGLVRRVLDWVWEHIGDLLGSAADASPGGAVGLIVIALVVVLLLVALRMRLGSPRPGPTSRNGTLFGTRPGTAADHRAAADAHAAEHRWSEALQERMRAIVLSLEERALLDPRPGRTADEAATDAGRALPGHATELANAARAFDEVTYAERTADEAAYLRVRDLDHALRSARPDLARPAAAGAVPPSPGAGR